MAADAEKIACRQHQSCQHQHHHPCPALYLSKRLGVVRLGEHGGALAKARRPRLLITERRVALQYERVSEWVSERAAIFLYHDADGHLVLIAKV